MVQDGTVTAPLRVGEEGRGSAPAEDAAAAGVGGLTVPGVGGGEDGGRPPWAFGPYGPEPYWEEPPYESPKEEIADLKEQEASLREGIEAIQKRLAELEKEASGQ